MASQEHRVRDRHVVVTGASSGIGRAAALELARRGARVTVVGRSAARTREVAAAVGGDALVCDFEDLDAVRGLGQHLVQRGRPVDVLVNNAGTMSARRVETRDGHERTLQTNHLAPLLLLLELRSALVASRGVVITTASVGNALCRGPFRLRWDDLENRRRYGPWKAYLLSKLAAVMTTRELARRWGPDGVTAVSFHPGEIASGFASGNDSPVHWLYHGPALLRRGMQTPEEGADTLLWLADGRPGVDWSSGGHYTRRAPGLVHPMADDPRACARMWEESAALLGADPGPPAAGGSRDAAP